MSDMFPKIWGFIFLITICICFYDGFIGFTFDRSIMICDHCHDTCNSRLESWLNECVGLYDGLESVCEEKKGNFSLTECHNKCWAKYACKRTIGDGGWNEP